MKFSKTTLCVQVVPNDTSIGALADQIREALIESNQPMDDVLGRPFSEMQSSDFELFVKEEDNYVPLSNRASASSRSKDGTPLCSACGLQDCSVLYMGFRADSQGTSCMDLPPEAPRFPVVQEPSLEDEPDEAAMDRHSEE